VTNDLRGGVRAGIDYAEVEAGGDLTVEALEVARLSATVSGITETLPEETAEEAGTDAAPEEAAAADTGGAGGGDAAAGGGESLAGGTSVPIAVNGLIANNLVLSSATAAVTESLVESGGSVSVNADNASEILAENTASITSGGTAVGVTLAFNTVGWEPQNIFSKAADALLGGDIGTERPASALAKIENTRLEAGGDLDVTATVSAVIDASISNEASSEGGAAASMVLATNKVSSGADAFILVPQASTSHDLSVAGDLTVEASDAPEISASSTIVAASAGGDGGEGDGEYFAVDFNSADGEQEIDFGIQVLPMIMRPVGIQAGSIATWGAKRPRSTSPRRITAIRATGMSCCRPRASRAMYWAFSSPRCPTRKKKSSSPPSPLEARNTTSALRSAAAGLT
jgi:hypothetical protein